MIPTPYRQFQANRYAAMRPTQFAMNAAKKSGSKYNIPVELTPLFIATGVAIASAIFFTTKKFTSDESLRVGRKNPNQSNLDKVLQEENK